MNRISTFVLALALVTNLRAPEAWADLNRVVTKRTDHFTFVYRERYWPVIRTTVAGAEEARAGLLDELGIPGDSGQRAEVRFARNTEEMRLLSPRPPPGWADAVAFWPDNVIVISLTTSHHRPVTLDTVFLHELSHLALRWAVGEARMPRWFNEGLAIHHSQELAFDRLRLLWPAAMSNSLLPINRLDETYPSREFEVNLAYAQSADFVRYLIRRGGRWRIQELIERLSRGEPFYAALTSTWDSNLRGLERAWRRDVRERFSTIPSLTAGATLWVVAGFLVLAAYIRRRRDVRARIAAMGDEDG